MSVRFEELDWRPTPLGAISLRRRREPTTGHEVYEVKLDDDYLMSSMFTAAEVALAELALDRLGDRADLDVVVGGLGLGYTARAVLDDPRVRRLVVIDALEAVIDWHRQGLVPLGAGLVADPRCSLVQGDFFAMVAASEGLDGQPGRRLVDALVVDIDHSPRHLLNPANGGFYTTPGLLGARAHLREGGVFALWSNDPPDDLFLETLSSAFAEPRAHVVTFPNPLQGGVSTNTVYVCTAEA